MKKQKTSNNIFIARLQKFLKQWEGFAELSFLKHLQKEFPKSNVYLVGGMVRDIALGLDSKDFDFVVTGIPPKKLFSFLSKHGSVDLVGKSFGVYKFIPKKLNKKIEKKNNAEVNNAIDIALPRTEKSLGSGAYRDFAIQSDHRLPIEEDLKRRDFTINAIALAIQTQNSRLKTQDPKLPATSYQLPANVIDPHNGLKDLEKKCIRTVGRAVERFSEDYSRMLRAIRFACQLDFEIETESWKTLKKFAKRIDSQRNGQRTVPYENIAKELTKAIAKNPVWALELLDESGLLKILIPELLKMKRCPQPKEFHTEGDVWEHTLLALKKLSSKEFSKEFPKTNKKNDKKKLGVESWKLEISPAVVWSLLFHDVGKPYTLTITDRIRTNGHDIKGAQIFEKIADRLRLSSARIDIETIRQIIGKHMIAIHAQDMKETTLEKYFYSQMFPGKELLMVMFADILATIPLSGKPDFRSYRILKKRIHKLEKISQKRKILPKDLLDGNEIMKLLKIQAGVEVGKIKEELRELQLSGKITTKSDAIQFLEKKREKKNV